MIQRVIVPETDRASADQIIRALRDNGIDTATVATSMRETCHFVAHRTFDLALIPLEYLSHQLDTLRRIEPDLRFILTAKSRESFQNPPMGESVLGVIPLDDLDPLLAELLTDADDVPQRIKSPIQSFPWKLEQLVRIPTVLRSAATSEPVGSIPSVTGIVRTSGGRSNQEGDRISGGSRWSGLANLLAFLGPRLFFGALVLLFIIGLSYLGINIAGGMSVGEVSLDAFPDTVAYVERLLHSGLGLTGIPMISTICRAITWRMPAGR